MILRESRLAYPEDRPRLLAAVEVYMRCYVRGELMANILVVEDDRCPRLDVVAH